MPLKFLRGPQLRESAGGIIAGAATDSHPEGQRKRTAATVQTDRCIMLIIFL